MAEEKRKQKTKVTQDKVTQEIGSRNGRLTRFTARAEAGGSTAEALRKHNNMERSEVKADMFKLFLIEFVCFEDF